MASAVVYLTNQCDLRCRHCFVGNDQLSKRPHLTIEEAKRTLSALQAGGVTTVTLLGGEVTTRADLPELLTYCDGLGLDVSINSNLLSYVAIEPLLEHNSLTNIVVSLDGVRATSHDAIRGKGSFDRTVACVSKVFEHSRVRDGRLSVDMTFVLTKPNLSDTLELPEFYKRFGFRKLNFKTLQFNDRAETNKDHISVDPKELLDTLTAFYVMCLSMGGIELDMYIPPAFGAYLDKVASAPERFWNYAACGGASVYTYVDMYGNNMPCPAMSVEENAQSRFTGQLEPFSLLEKSLTEVQEHELFTNFERTRVNGTRRMKMAPCNICAFADKCTPCTNEIIRGRPSATVDICHAVFAHADDRVQGFTKSIFAT